VQGVKTAEEIAGELLGSIWVNYLELNGLKIVFEKDWQELEKRATNKGRKPALIGFTLGKYYDLRAQGYKDWQIAKLMKVSDLTLRSWLRKNGVPPKVGQEPVTVNMTVEQYRMLVDEGRPNYVIAEMAGVSESRFYKWKKEMGVIKKRGGAGEDHRTG
jgi:hypothetical protein